MSRTKTTTMQFEVYDCPICGQETKLYCGETEACSRCANDLRDLEYYQEHSYLMGAEIIEFYPDLQSIAHIHIRLKDGTERCISVEDGDMWIGKCLF